MYVKHLVSGAWRALCKCLPLLLTDIRSSFSFLHDGNFISEVSGLLQLAPRPTTPTKGLCLYSQDTYEDHPYKVLTYSGAPSKC